MRLTSETYALERPRRRTVWETAVVLGTLGLVFELDRRTGSAPVQHLYYLPIILASLRLGRRAGLSAAIVAIVLYHLANLARFIAGYGDADVVQTILFVLVGVVTAKLSADASRLRQLAMTDDLTGLHNLRSFEARLVNLIRTSRETRTPLAMLVLDVDRLKAINDTYGHLAGAEAVRLVGHTLAAHLPPGAIACRYGGDEFAIAISRCGSALAETCAEELRGAVQALAPVLAGRVFPAGALSISVGLACLDDDCPSAPASDVSDSRDDVSAGERLFGCADKALYVAKQQGRNRVSALANPAWRAGELAMKRN